MNKMKITLNSIHHKPSAPLMSFLRKELGSLEPDLRIDEARVRLVRDAEASPPFSVAFHLVTPGPDVTAESRDHTLRAALLKAFGVLRGKIGHRRAKQTRRTGNDHITAGPRRIAARGPRQR